MRPWSPTAEARAKEAYLLFIATALVSKVSCPALHLPACGRSELSAILHTLSVQRLAPGADLRPTRGWAVATSIMHHIITFGTNFADKLMGNSSESIVAHMVDGTLGAGTPGADPTPQKRGPPPKPNWRGGRLPSLLAAECRPKIFPQLPLLSTYRNFHITHL
jgi:hypothetical protein